MCALFFCSGCCCCRHFILCWLFFFYLFDLVIFSIILFFSPFHETEMHVTAKIWALVLLWLCSFALYRLIKSESKCIHGMGTKMSNITETQLTYKCIRLICISFCVRKNRILFAIHRWHGTLMCEKSIGIGKPVSILYTLCFLCLSRDIRVNVFDRRFIWFFFSFFLSLSLGCTCSYNFFFISTVFRVLIANIFAFWSSIFSFRCVYTLRQWRPLWNRFFHAVVWLFWWFACSPYV